MSALKTQKGRAFNAADATPMSNNMFNKGTAFSECERQAFHMRGLFPAAVETLEQQTARCYKQFQEMSTPLQKFIYLNQLQEQNATLFYSLVTSHIEEMIPIVYTPVVGEACVKYSSIWRKPIGLFISAKDKGHIREVLDSWKNPVELIVVSDGSRILGLGDLGTNGMGIPVGKLSLYVAAALFHPECTLPILLDVGCNRAEIRDAPDYLGLRQERLPDEEYYPFVAEFMAAVKDKWPECLVQFEDFQNPRCFKLLDQYFTKQLCFNDDIQGTGAVITSGFINAVKVSGIPIKEQRLLFFGAGSAANGVGSMIATWMAEQLGVDVKETRKQIRMIDSKGLITVHRTNLDEHKRDWVCDAADCKDNVAIVRDFKPTALMGLSGQPKQFSKEVLEEMCKHCKRPIVFALSNPTSKSECTAEEAYTYTDGTCIFASGSPFAPVTYKGKTYTPGQGNNMYIFPGLGFGAKLAKAKVVTEDMIMSTAITLAGCVSKEQLEQGMIYPRVADVQDISRKVAAGVIRTAIKNGVCQLSPVPEDIDKYVADSQWKVEYPHM